MISRFFIDHPVFANVIAIITVFIGFVALYRLPVEQYSASARGGRWWAGWRPHSQGYRFCCCRAFLR